MKAICTILWWATSLASVLSSMHAVAAPSTRAPDTAQPAIEAVLETIRERYHLPAVAGAIVTSTEVAAIGAVGVRKSGTTASVTTNDLWHLGSNTKAMTATLVARLVETGRASWDTSLGEVFPELAPSFAPGMRGVTFRHLLSHHAGLPANLAWESFRGTIQEQRLAAVARAGRLVPATTPGTAYAYSNTGYVLAGAMLERLTGKSWETLMREWVFVPLGMTQSGFGGTGTAGTLDQPWGHTLRAAPVAVNGPATDNPPVLGPAGRVHATLRDWSAFIMDQLRGAEGHAGLLKAESYRALFSPPFGGDYALGWVTAERDWGGGKVYTHNGCNTMNFSDVWIAPARDFAVLVCVNQGDETAAEAADRAVWALIQWWRTLQARGVRQPPS